MQIIITKRRANGAAHASILPQLSVKLLVIHLYKDKFKLRPTYC